MEAKKKPTRKSRSSARGVYLSILLDILLAGLSLLIPLPVRGRF
jgi:hypothetical protein